MFLQKTNTKTIYILIALFLGLLITYILLFEKYSQDQEKNYTDTIKKEITLFVHSKAKDTFQLSLNLAQNKELIHVMQTKNYDDLYKPNFFKIPKDYLKYKHIKIHVVDNKGIQRYLSWTHHDLGKPLLHARDDLQKLYKNPHPLQGTSVGKFSISFKGIMPIYDKQHHFLGVVETITYFNSIAKELLDNNIYSTVLIDKRFQSQLIYPASKIFVEGYNVANNFIHKDTLTLLKKHGVSYFINNSSYKYVYKSNSFLDGYFTITVPIEGVEEQTIGYYVAFIQDKYMLARKEASLYLILVILTLLFLFMVYLVYKEHKKNILFIRHLDDEVKKQTDEKMKILYIDPQTGAYKKIKFDEDRKKVPDAKAILLNIRNFSKINASYGFDIGDSVLSICVKRFKNILQKDIYRLNADEFLFFSYEPKEDINKIKNDFALKPINIPKYNVNLRISFSFGVAKCKLDKLISKLSIAVNKAKKYPFSAFMHYRDKKINDDFIRFNSLLYEAIFREGHSKIVPFFQGIRNNESKKILKYEALARLIVDEKVYSPYFFIDIAKNSGFIHEITKIMIQKSCAYLATLDDNVEISLNITEDDFASRHLKTTLLTNTQKYNIKPNRITLEVLEGVTSIGSKNYIKQLLELKSLGFQLAIDDFGVEYSNFERISEVDVDFIKIDGKYIKTLCSDPKSYKITKAITDFAHSMGIRVVAEFVEDVSIQELVEKLEIEYTQGYYYSKPQETIE